MKNSQSANSGISIQASLSGYSFKVALVPGSFFSEKDARELLEAQTKLGPEDKVFWVKLPAYDAVLLYSAPSKDALPELYTLIGTLERNAEYNKVHMCWKNGCLNLVIAQGKNLLLANVYAAPDFTTAEYFIFLAMQQFQLNPEVTSICVGMPLTQEQEISLYSYFKAVVRL